MSKLPYIIILGYMLIAFTLPIRRVLFVWQDAGVPIFGFLIHPGQYIIMAVILTLTICVVFRPNFFLTRQMNYISQPKIVMPITYALLATCLTLTFLGLSGIWWTWLTLGIHIGCIALFSLLLKDRLPAGEAILLGFGCILIAVCIWEMVYQYGLYIYHDAPQGVPNWNLLGQLRFMAPFGLFGLATALLVAIKRRILTFNYTTVLFACLTTGAFTYWYLSGFWCDILYDWSTDWSTGTWYLNPESNAVSLIIYKSSKMWLNLLFVSIVWIAPTIRVPFLKKELCLQFGHCKETE